MGHTRSTNVLLLLFFLCHPALATTDSKDTSVAQGVPVTLSLWNAVADTKVSVSLTQETQFFSIEAKENPDEWKKHITLEGQTLTINIPADLLPNNDYPTLGFDAHMQFGPGSAGSLSIDKPMVFELKTPYGTTITQSEKFSLQTPTFPPTCVINGCGPDATSCPNGQRDASRSCYLYLGNYYCCIENPN